MIPYFEWHSFSVGPIPIQVWGLMVALGILVATNVAVWLARQRGQKPELFWDLVVWVTVAAFVGARVFTVFFYDWDYYSQNPFEILQVWNGGLSIIGGFVGATIVGLLFLKAKKVDVWAYTDTAMFGLPVGIMIGRLGCFFIHDHPGTATHFFLSVKYPDGVQRHDLGLDESILGLLIAIVFFVMWKKKAPVGSYTIVFLLLYGTARFFLDFLRATDGLIVDQRYFGLTPAQYACVAMVGTAVWLVRRQKLSTGKP